MSFRIRTVWLEIAAGFTLLFAAVETYAPRGAFPSVGAQAAANAWGSTLLLLSACAVFLLHPFRASRGVRRLLFLAAGAGAAFGGAWSVSAGEIRLAALLIGSAAWLLAASFLPWCDQRFAVVGEMRRHGFGIVAGGALAAIGAHGLAAGTATAWHASFAAAAASVVFGLALVGVEAAGAFRARRAATLLAAFAYLYCGVALLADGIVGAGGAMLAVFAFLILSATGDERLPEAADDLAGATPRQREIYAYERVGEMTLWALAALSAVFINFIDLFDARLYFSALLTIAFVTQYSYRFRAAAAISERRYLLTLGGIVAASIVLISATGGALGPFIYLAYLAVFAGTIIIRPVWSVLIACAYAGYVLIELAWHLRQDGGSGGDAHAAQYLFLAATLFFTGLYTAWTGKRRSRTDEALLAANRRLAEALREAVRERERYERQARDLKGLNENLLEMRSALMNVLEDVEESKRQIEIERRREAASFKALAEGVIAADKDGRIFLCNPAAARVLGVPVETVVGEPIERVLRLFQEDGTVMQTRAFEEAYAGKTVALGERLRLARADDTAVPVSGNVAPYIDDDGKTVGIVAAFRDVTVEREIDRQKSDFISIASHQLRTPMSALRWFLDLLLAGDAGALKPKQREYLGDMSASVTRMIKLIGDLLDISRIESGRTKPNPERIATAAFVESIAREFQPLVRAQDIAFTHQVAKDASSFYADPSLARQAVANVVSNAVKYTPAGGAVAVEASVKGHETIFRIKDTGLGIPAQQQYRVFDKFFRGENVVAQETVGSGLGLYVVKSIVELSGGRIWFESKEKKGTTFHIAFPNGPKALPGGAPGGTMAA